MWSWCWAIVSFVAFCIVHSAEIEVDCLIIHSVVCVFSARYSCIIRPKILMAMIKFSESTLSAQRNRGEQAYYPIPAIGYGSPSFPPQSPESKIHTLRKRNEPRSGPPCPTSPFPVSLIVQSRLNNQCVPLSPQRHIHSLLEPDFFGFSRRCSRLSKARVDETPVLNAGV